MGKALTITLACLLALAIISLAIVSSIASEKVQKPVVTPINVVNQPAYNDSALQNKVDAISKQVLQDSSWKDTAKSLALSEMTDNGNRKLFQAMENLNISIDTKSDIKSVEIYDSKNKVNSYDVEEQNADVSQVLLVRFENSNGDSKKVKLQVDSTITQGEVDDYNVTLY